MPEWILLFEESILLHCFNDTSSTRNIAKAEDNSERDLGSFIDLQLDDNRDWKDGEEKVRDAVD